jgi:hypothetical protein
MRLFDPQAAPPPLRRRMAGRVCFVPEARP